MLEAIGWNSQLLIQCQFDTCGREISRQQSNSVTFTQSFDVQGRLSEQSWQQAEKPHRRCYQYNDGNQLVGIQDSEQGISQYQFDPLDQLSLSHLPTGEEAFSFDSFGNPEGEDTEVSDDRLLSFQGNRYRYDTFGNQIRMQSPAGYQQRQYNGLNQLTSVKTGGRYTQYQYDALGRRSTKITEGGRTDYLWDGEQLIGEHCNGEYTWYLYEPGTFKPVALIKQGQIYYYHLDHLGTPLKLTDRSGAVVWDAQYQTFGAVTLYVETISNPLRFQGQYYDEEIGLHYNHFRYYDPSVGRFIHQDPIGLLGGLNHYQYAPNPVQWIDPLGLSCKEKKSGLNEKTFAVTQFGSIEPIQGWASKGFLKTMISDATFGIVYGETSSIPFLRADPIDRAEMEAYEAVAGLERYASIFIPTGAANFAKNAILEGVQLAKPTKFVRELAGSVDEVVPNTVDKASRRAYLNEKYGRTGDLNADINVRGDLNTYYPSPSKLSGSTSPKRPGGYQVQDADAHGNLSPGRNRAPGNKNEVANNLIQSHHAIQHEWAKINVPGYKKNEAPGVLLPSSSGMSHANISSAQRTRRATEGFNTDIRYEFNTSYREMIDAGVPESVAKKGINQSYKYYDNLGAFQ